MLLLILQMACRSWLVQGLESQAAWGVDDPNQQAPLTMWFTLVTDPVPYPAESVPLGASLRKTSSEHLIQQCVLKAVSVGHWPAFIPTPMGDATSVQSQKASASSFLETIPIFLNTLVF